MRLTPALAKCRAVSAIISPAPIISAVCALKSAIYAPREAHRRGGEGDRIRADPGLGAHALGGGKSGLKQLVERGAGAAGLLSDPIGVLQLPEDLRFAEHHGVESRGDVEGMLDGEAFLMDVEARGEIEIVAVMALQPLRQLRAAGACPTSTPRCGCRWTGSPPRRRRSPAAGPQRGEPADPR